MEIVIVILYMAKECTSPMNAFSLGQSVPASCTLMLPIDLPQGTKTERLGQDGSEQFSPGHGLQTRGLAGQSHYK